MTRKKIIAVLTALTAMLLPLSVWAVEIVPACARVSDSNTVPNLDCVLQTLGNIAQIILGLAGGLTLLMFVYGGFMMLSSGGAEGRVTKGKDAIKAALVGLAIILLAGYLVSFGLDRLGVDEEFLEVPKTETPESSDTSGQIDCTQVPVGSACSESSCGAEPGAGSPCGGPIQGATCQGTSGSLTCQGLAL